MKHCPTCQRGYDDAHKFCLQDGAPLIDGAPAWSGAPPAAGSSPTTPVSDAHMRTPRVEVGAAGAGTGGAHYANNVPPPRDAHVAAGEAPKKRKVWPFVVAGVAVVGLGAIVLLGGVGAYFLSRARGTQTAGYNANFNAAMNANMPAGFGNINGAGPGMGFPPGGNFNSAMPPGGGNFNGGPGAPGGGDFNQTSGMPPSAGPMGGGGGDGEVNVDGNGADTDDGADGGGGVNPNQGAGPAPGGGGGGGATMAEINRVESEFIRANVKGDRAALENILADSFTASMNGGQPINKQQFIQNIKGASNITSFNSENVQLIEKGNTATLVGVLVLQGPQGQQRFRFADTFERQGGRWRMVNSQLAAMQ